MTKARKIGIFGGSFNPVHIGHTIIASYLQQTCGLDEVWMMLSPLNPLKTAAAPPAPDNHRLAMLRIATEAISGVTASDFELSLPLPSYTYRTLSALRGHYPDYEFTLIIGADNWTNFEKWRDHDKIIAEFPILIYPRDGYSFDADSLPSRVSAAQCPKIEISSTFIRQSISDGINVNLFLPEGVYSYIKQNNLYDRQ